MSLYVGPGSGMELLGRQALIALTASLNTEIANVSSHWVALDQELATLRSRTYASIPLQTFASDHFHLGHRPSLIEAPPGNYPSVSTMAYRGAPGTDQPDQFDSFSLSLYVETFINGTETEGEEIVNSRIQRTTESIQNVIARDPNFRNSFFAIQRPPIVMIGELFVRKEEKGRGARLLWQGSRVEYVVDAYVNPRGTW